MKRINFLFITFLILISQSLFAQQGKVTLEDIWVNYRYLPDFTPGFRWMNDDQYYSTLNQRGKIAILQNSILDGEITPIVSLNGLEFGDGFSANDISDYDFNSDESKVLLKGKSEAIYRRSSKEVCFVYDRDSKKITSLHDGEQIGNATFSPDASKIAYTFDNNLYYQDLNSGKRVQITFDGSWNHIINGSTDWVYEEELSLVKAFEWAPDNQKIAFYRFDENKVREFSMAMYGELYPEQYTFKYPKAGEDNSLVTIHIFDLANGKTLPTNIGPETDQYIARMRWTGDGQLALMRLNRLQNQLDVLMVNPATGQSSVLLNEKNDTYQEVQVYHQSDADRWIFLKNNESFIWTSDRSGYNHIYMFGRDGEMKSQITKGDFDVVDIAAVDEENEIIYFVSSEKSPLERHLYSIGFNGKKKKCLTEEKGTHAITFSSGNNYYLDAFSSAADPGRTVLRDAKGKEIKELANNSRLRKQMETLAIKAPEFFKFKTSENVSLNGWMIKPADFDASKKYPVLMFCYGGPASQTVTDEWGSGRPFNYFWYQMLAQQGYIIVSVDNRGTAARGAEFLKSTYADLGRLETVDQIEAAKYLQKQAYVDAGRVGIWGWSYGGYLTSLCMTKGNGLFKAGIAVAPVTNWRFYDTIYTERYLKRPQENAKGYDENSPINFAKDLQGEYLLIHGTADDNVHYQNSLEWVSALVNANKQFDMFFYPNKNHGIFGGITRYHLYRKMTDFVMENL
jgi:dipeptidyl-peptidase-4